MKLLRFSLKPSSILDKFVAFIKAFRIQVQILSWNKAHAGELIFAVGRTIIPILIMRLDVCFMNMMTKNCHEALFEVGCVNVEDV